MSHEGCSFFDPATGECRLRKAGMMPIPTLTKEGTCANKGEIKDCVNGEPESKPIAPTLHIIHQGPPTPKPEWTDNSYIDL